MRPRLLLRTHYQADEPALIIAGVTRCSSPVEARDEDTIAATLKRWAQKNGYTISIPAAVYAIDNARHMEFLNKSNRWGPKGLALAFAKEHSNGVPQRELSPIEERLYLYSYLHAGGALVVAFASWLRKQGRTSHGQLRKEAIIEHLLAHTLDEYLALAVEVRDRTELRNERDRLRKLKYASSTKRHKRYPLLVTLRRLRLLEMGADEGGEIGPDNAGRLLALSDLIPDVIALERLIRDRTLQRRLDTEMKEVNRRDLPRLGDPLTVLLSGYEFAMQIGVQACALEFLDQILMAAFPASQLAKSPSAEEILDPIHRNNPGLVRFHVDRRGTRAFVLIEKRVLKALAGEPAGRAL